LPRSEVWIDQILVSLDSEGEWAMEMKEFGLNDVVEMKKGHPCGANAWKIIRMGADIRIKCESGRAACRESGNV